MDKTEAIAWLGLSIALTGFLMVLASHIIFGLTVGEFLAYLWTMP